LSKLLVAFLPFENPKESQNFLFHLYNFKEVNYFYFHFNDHFLFSFMAFDKVIFNEVIVSYYFYCWSHFLFLSLRFKLGESRPVESQGE
jgi:hypothetical protein